jgi:HEPN domain-containing protein
MPKKKVTLLDRAVGDLAAVKLMLNNAASDDVLMDICAYHCQQCAEKVAKYLILLQGDFYANDHYSISYLEDLKDEEAIAIIEGIAAKIDAWATTIRYASSILSNQKAVLEVLESCEQLVDLAKKKTPMKSNAPAYDVRKMNKFGESKATIDV